MRCARLRKGKEFGVGLFYMGPTRGLGRCLGLKGSAVFFSTALLPVSCCGRLLSIRGSSCTICTRSGFPRGGEGVLVKDRTDAGCARENARVCHGVTRCLEVAISKGGKGCVTFFPSCRFVRSILRRFRGQSSKMRLMVRSRFVSRGRERRFLRVFRRRESRPVLKFYIVNNMFSRKVSLARSELVKIVIIKAKVPRMYGSERVIGGCFSREKVQKFSCTCLCPKVGGMLRSTKEIVHARSSEKVVLLLSSQFRGQRCRRLFPER